MALPNKPILFRIMNCQNTMVNKDEKRLEPLLLERANNRAGHVSLQLESLIIIWGGYNPKNKAHYPTNEFIFLNLETNEWSLKLSNGIKPGNCSGTTACISEEKIYIFGGWHTRTASIQEFYSNRIPESSVVIYDTDIENQTLSFGFMSNSIWSIDLRSMSWKEHTPKGIPPLRSDKCSSWIRNKKFYIFGGFGPPPVNKISDLNGVHFTFVENRQLDTNYEDFTLGWSNQLFIYNISTSTFEWPICIGYVPSPRAALASCILGGKAYMFGGRGVHGRMNDLFSLDLEDLHWKQILPNTQDNNCMMPKGRSWHSLTSLVTGKQEGGILLYGGFDSNHNTINDCWKMDLAVNPPTWQRLKHLEKGPRLWHTMHTLSDNKVFILGGRIGKVIDLKATRQKCPLWKLIVNPKSLQETTIEYIKENKTIFERDIKNLPQSLKRTIQGNEPRDL